MLTRLAERVAAWWKALSNDTVAKYAKALGLPWPSNWRLLPYFLLLVLLFILFPLFLLIARIIIRRARNKEASDRGNG
jgi:hypothetical protein